MVDCFFFLFPYFRRKRSPGSTSTGDGDSFLKTVYSVESEYSNNKIESIPIRKEDFIIPGFPNLTTGTETLLFQAGNRELLFGTAFDLRLAATIKVIVGVFSIGEKPKSVSEISFVRNELLHRSFHKGAFPICLASVCSLLN